MKPNQIVKLLTAQISKLAELEATENHEAYDAWHKHTELLLQRIMGAGSAEVNEFSLQDGRSAVIVAGNQLEDEHRDSETYFRHIKSNRSLLTGLLEFFKSAEANEEDPTEPVAIGSLDALHSAIKGKCSSLYISKNYPEAVEKGFKVVRDRLRELTSYETGSEAFGKGGLFINGASASNVEHDFQSAVKFLTMAIDQFRNEKSHTSDGNIDNPVRAYEYLALSSLAMHLLDNAEVKESAKPDKPEKQNAGKKSPSSSQDSETLVKLDPLQILCMQAFGAMSGYKELLISRMSGGVSMVHALGQLSDSAITKALHDADGPELEANLNELAGWGIVDIYYNKHGSPIYRLAKPGYTLLKEYPSNTPSKRKTDRP